MDRARIRSQRPPRQGLGFDALASATLFALLTGYYLLRPVRDELGVQSAAGDLPVLFTLTFAVSAVLVAVLRRLARGGRERAGAAWLAFAASLAGLALLLDGQAPSDFARHAAFVWITAWGYLLVALFWSEVAEAPGARRLGLIAAGGSAGALLGPALAAVLAGPLGLDGLVMLGAALVAAAAAGAAGLARLSAGAESTAPKDPAPGAGAGSLGALATYVGLLQLVATLFYFRQIEIVEAMLEDPLQRAQLFAAIDLGANALAMVLQLLVTPLLMRRPTLTAGLLLTPLVAAGGFVWLALFPSAGAAAAGGAVRRAVEYAVARPSREVLFQAVGAEQRRRRKVAVDAGLTRGADMAGAWLAVLLLFLGPAAAVTGQLIASAAFAFAGVAAGRALAARARPRPRPVSDLMEAVP